MSTGVGKMFKDPPALLKEGRRHWELSKEPRGCRLPRNEKVLSLQSTCFESLTCLKSIAHSPPLEWSTSQGKSLLSLVPLSPGRSHSHPENRACCSLFPASLESCDIIHGPQHKEMQNSSGQAQSKKCISKWRWQICSHTLALFRQKLNKKNSSFSSPLWATSCHFFLSNPSANVSSFVMKMSPVEEKLLLLPYHYKHTNARILFQSRSPLNPLLLYPINFMLPEVFIL